MSEGIKIENVLKNRIQNGDVVESVGDICVAVDPDVKLRDHPHQPELSSLTSHNTNTSHNLSHNIAAAAQSVLCPSEKPKSLQDAEAQQGPAGCRVDSDGRVTSRQLDSSRALHLKGVPKKVRGNAGVDDSPQQGLQEEGDPSGLRARQSPSQPDHEREHGHAAANGCPEDLQHGDRSPRGGSCRIRSPLLPELSGDLSAVPGLHHMGLEDLEGGRMRVSPGSLGNVGRERAATQSNLGLKIPTKPELTADEGSVTSSQIQQTNIMLAKLAEAVVELKADMDSLKEERPRKKDKGEEDMEHKGMS